MVIFCLVLYSLLNLLQGLVDELYHFRDHYFATHNVEDASRKQNDVTQEMNKTLQRLEEKEGKRRGQGGGNDFLVTALSGCSLEGQ